MNISMERRFRGALLAMAAAALVIATPALAERPLGQDVAVRYSDLDVDTVEGATQLLDRIQRAADAVCAPLDHGDMTSRGAIRRCEKIAVAEAVAKANHPVLAAVHKSANPAAPQVAALAK